jgi:hypothetical protein
MYWLRAEQEAGCANSKDRIIDRGSDPITYGHSDGETKGQDRASDGGLTGEPAEEEQDTNGNLPDGGYDREKIGELAGQESHYFTGIGGKMCPVAPADPGFAVGSPEAEAVEAEKGKACSKSEAEIKLSDTKIKLGDTFLHVSLNYFRTNI